MFYGSMSKWFFFSAWCVYFIISELIFISDLVSLFSFPSMSGQYKKKRQACKILRKRLTPLRRNRILKIRMKSPRWFMFINGQWFLSSEEFRLDSDFEKNTKRNYFTLNVPAENIFFSFDWFGSMVLLLFAVHCFCY